MDKECDNIISYWYTYIIYIYKVKSCVHASTDASMYKCTDARVRSRKDLY